MSEQASRDPLEPGATAARIVPEQHLDQMNHFMFHDPLQRFQSIATGNPGHQDRFGIVIGERAKDQGGRERNFELAFSCTFGDRSGGDTSRPGHSRGDAKTDRRIHAIGGRLDHFSEYPFVNRPEYERQKRIGKRAKIAGLDFGATGQRPSVDRARIFFDLGGAQPAFQYQCLQRLGHQCLSESERDACKK